MLVELLAQYTTKKSTFVPALIVACFIALYLIWSLIDLYGRAGKFQGKILGAIVITLLFVILAIIAWNDR